MKDMVMLKADVIALRAVADEARRRPHLAGLDVDLDALADIAEAVADGSEAPADVLEDRTDVDDPAATAPGARTLAERVERRTDDLPARLAEVVARAHLCVEHLERLA